MNCPRCGSENVVKNGSIHNGKLKSKCNDCEKQFVINPTKKYIPKEAWDLVAKLLLERISIAGISRVTGISEPWLQKYINAKYKDVKLDIENIKKGRLVM